MALPFALSLDRNVYCNGKSVYLCDATWNRLKEASVDAAVFKKGENRIELSGVFRGIDGPFIHCEFKTTGKPERVMAR